MKVTGEMVSYRWYLITCVITNNSKMNMHHTMMMHENYVIKIRISKTIRDREKSHLKISGVHSISVRLRFT